MKCEQEVVEEWVQQLPQVIPALIQLVIEGGPTEKEAAEQLRPLVQAGSVMGAFLGDELLWGGLSYPDLVAAVRLVRGSFPPPFIIYANEALPVLQDDSWQPMSCLVNQLLQRCFVC